LSHHEVSETFFAFGHLNVQAKHRSTLEFTKHAHLSRMGDCIVAVSSEKGLADLSDAFKEALRQPEAKLTITIEADDVMEQIHAHGSPNLSLSHPSDMVVRRSGYVDSRTLAVGADKSACDLNRGLVEKMRYPQQKAKITLIVRS
jgi:hypothetical protein